MIIVIRVLNICGIVRKYTVESFGEPTMLHQADMSSLAVDSLLKQLARDRQAIFKAAVDWQSVLNQLLTRRFKPMSCRGPDFLAVTPS